MRVVIRSLQPYFLPVSKLTELLPPNLATGYLRFDILFFSVARQRTSLFISDVLEPVQGVIPRIEVEVRKMGC